MRKKALLFIILIIPFSLLSCLSFLESYNTISSIYFRVENATNDSTCSEVLKPRELKFSIKNLDNDTLTTLSETVPLEGLWLSYPISSKDRLEIAFYELNSSIPIEKTTIKFNLITNDPQRSIKYCEKDGIVLRDF